jgi:hypothetical protein
MQLRPYQDEAADFLYERDRAMILAPVGAGKTAITLTAMQAMIKDGHAKRFLVLAPKRVCTDVWPVEQPSGRRLCHSTLRSVHPNSVSTQYCYTTMLL